MHARTAAFDIDEVMAVLADATRDLPKAALFDLHDRGYTSAFEQLVACIISIRTFDEVTTPVAERVFEQARTPREIATLGVERLAALMKPSTFAEAKARQIVTIAETVVAEHGGELPCDEETLLDFGGVGPKCAGLVLGIACRQPRIGVDVHVHRVTNRWGYVAAATPEKTLAALRKKLPERYWVDINRHLVPFGKHVCTGRAPRCSTCPLRKPCRRVGVTSSR